jgi:hypothetical protein
MSMKMGCDLSTDTCAGPGLRSADAALWIEERAVQGSDTIVFGEALYLDNAVVSADIYS